MVDDNTDVSNYFCTSFSGSLSTMMFWSIVAITAPAVGVVVFQAGDNCCCGVVGVSNCACVIVGCDTQLHKRNPAPVLDDVAYMIREGVSSKLRPCGHLAPALPMSGRPLWLDKNANETTVCFFVLRFPKPKNQLNVTPFMFFWVFLPKPTKLPPQFVCFWSG
jgi:hypothetical protein